MLFRPETADLMILVFDETKDTFNWLGRIFFYNDKQKAQLLNNLARHLNSSVAIVVTKTGYSQPYLTLRQKVNTLKYELNHHNYERTPLDRVEMRIHSAYKLFMQIGLASLKTKREL